jgi:acetyltransferase-like isoleucine patch superfamily enzyme
MSGPAVTEPLLAAAPPAGGPPAGVLALARARWAVLRTRGRVTAGRGAALGAGVRWDLGPGARVHLGARCAVGPGTRVQVPAGSVRIGVDAILGERCVLQIRTSAQIGAGARLGDEVVLLDHRPRFSDPERPIRAQGVQLAPVTVGPQAIVGSRTVLGPGAAIGRRAHVGASIDVACAVADGARIESSPPPVW